MPKRRMNGAIPTPCHKLSWLRQEQLNFNFCFLRISAVLFHFASVSLYFGTLLLHIQFHSFYEHSHLSFPHLYTIHRCQLHLAVPCQLHLSQFQSLSSIPCALNPLNAELNPICHLLALLGVHHIFHVSRIRVKSLTLRLLMSYIYIY